MIKLATAERNGQQRLVVLRQTDAIDLKEAVREQPVEGLTPECCKDMLAFIEAGDEAVKALRAYKYEGTAAVYPLEELKLLAPIPHPLKNVVSVGRNYGKHMNEIEKTDNPAIPSSIRQRSKRPVFLSQPWTAITGPDSAIEVDFSIDDQIDYEGELAVILGKKGKNISVENAMDYIFGYSIMNDASSRAIQFLHNLPFKGKSLDTFMPFGPCIVLRDDIADISKLRIVTKVNGEVRQNGTCDDMIFNVPELIYYLSMGMTVHPGDIISTGTPSGVAIGFDPPKYLKDGDVVSICIEEIGTLENTVKKINE